MGHQHRDPPPGGRGAFPHGLEHLRFLATQSRGGRDGSVVFLDPALIAAQRTEGYGPATPLAYGPYQDAAGWTCHHALGN